jgi:flavin reductase (DIM6/NTAB) family NADH-FMN oxidoreductase RutF
MKKVITRIEKLYQFYPCTVAIVGARSEGRINYMACAWHTTLSFNPPLFGVLITKKRFTHEIISSAREFTANFIRAEKVKLSAQLGRTSGHDLDKTRAYKVRLKPSQVIDSPILEEAYAAFECKVVDIRPYGDHDLFVGEVLAVHEEKGCFDEKGLLNTGKIRPLLYMGSDFYITIDPDSLKHVLPD